MRFSGSVCLILKSRLQENGVLVSDRSSVSGYNARAEPRESNYSVECDELVCNVELSYAAREDVFCCRGFYSFPLGSCGCYHKVMM